MPQPIKQAIFLMGPTASGKTALAIAISQQLPVDIISVDSALIYRGMDIGTGKPAAAILQTIPHALVNILDPAASYSAAQFCEDAYRCMQASIARGRVPLLVGGTMMYFHALQHGLSELPATNWSRRAELQQELAHYGSAVLHARLHRLDPVAAVKIHPNDPQRILRALEVIAATGRTFSSQLIERQQLLKDWRIKKIAVAPQARQTLHHHIEQRFYAMLEQGFVAEVAGLIERGDLHVGLPSMRAVGYRQIWQHLHGELSYQEMVTKSIAATRQLAKRQFTWARRWDDLLWQDSGTVDLCANVVAAIQDHLSQPSS